ncbi:HNH endonuclease [Micrococcus sp.]|uniref:HNH endonuclease n=1 Tax=Micrococcus sp. TaxID=1271 RepID=UPI0026DD5B96|nr:HNH endonuclease [Micrococcus sp.]MDO4239356.1 HNH endonuclease [Micrococcus sp.]
MQTEPSLGSGPSDLEPPVEPLSEALEDVARVVRGVGLHGLSRDQWLEYAALLGQKIARLEKTSSDLSAHFGLTSAQKRMLEYLRLHVNELVDRRALRGVAGIDDWARRVRELRVEHGWPIVSSAQDDRVPKDSYRLEALEPDEELASRWRLANEIRKHPGSGYERGLAYLKAIYPQAAQADEMHYVMKIKSYARRVREMAEHGWMIASNIDDPELAPGSYRLTTLEQAPPRVRKAIKLRHEVFYRDGHRCADCGRSPANDGIVLHAHHLRMVSEGGDNSLENLVTVCPDCHAGRHAGITAREVQDELINPLGDVPQKK